MKNFINNFMLKFATVIAGLALLVTTSNVNSTCIFISHQPTLPISSDKLKKLNA